MLALPSNISQKDQENSRNSQNDVVSERAFREIYLKQFETAVKMSNPMGMMSTYGMVNSVPTANDYELLENILRTEWGFEGIVMTTGADPVVCPMHRLCIPVMT